MFVTGAGDRGRPTSTLSPLPPNPTGRPAKRLPATCLFAKEHPEGWRLVGVTYSGGFCEFFPHWGEGGFSDYSPASQAGFREWLKTRYETEAKLRVAWKNDAVTLETAALPAPAERLRGDWFDFYDPTKGMHRIDFCSYYAEVATGLIARLAKAFKEGSNGRFYTRPMAGYQPCGSFFRFHAGPHADFAAILECPWIDGFFQPNDYQGRGLAAYTGFDIPLASILLHGKTYIKRLTTTRTSALRTGAASRPRRRGKPLSHSSATWARLWPMPAAARSRTGPVAGTRTRRP